MGKLFGGSKSKSGNYAYDAIKGAFSPLLGYTGEGAGGLSALLKGDTSGLERFKGAMGYDWDLGQGVAGLAARNLSKGLGNSGATLKGLADYQTGLNSKYASSYLDALSGLTQTGLSAGQTLAGAGQWSTGKTTQGLAPLLGAAGSIFAGGAKF
ncbi:MAG: hypothetical protein E6R03_10760 [Hyphomicrobiaceae bacterium]|nr:MAG: hypothetical protein E6R03_10760 [Hyphomicrobiaceae bacterium]